MAALQFFMLGMVELIDTSGMSFKEKLLYHQIHPLKLTTDILAAYGALWLYWQHQLFIGILITFGLPVIASIATLGLFDVSYLRESVLGQYAERHMTQGVALTRFLGNIIMLSGAWYHNWLLIILGTLWLAACWGWGVVLEWFSAKA
jgi:hypothetical protein